jgi:hypothetical protein
MSGCGAEPERECPTFEVEGQGEFRPDGTPSVLADAGRIELAVGLCVYDDQNLLLAFAPSPVFAEDYLHRARLLLATKGAGIEEFDFSQSRGFVASIAAESGRAEHSVTVNYIPSVAEEDFGGSFELTEVGLRPGDGFLVVGYN